MGALVVIAARTPVQLWVAAHPSGTNANPAEVTDSAAPGSQFGSPPPRSATTAYGPKSNPCSMLVTSNPFGRRVTSRGIFVPGAPLALPTCALTASAGGSVGAAVGVGVSANVTRATTIQATP